MKPAPSIVRSRIVPASAAVAVVALMGGGVWYLFDALSTQPIKRVVFAGDVQKLARADLVALAQSVQGASPSGASLAAVREAARRIPWARDATVRRHFPDAVEITFETHEPAARWGEGALVSTRGEIFTARFEGFLPLFRGPEGSAAAMVREYPAIVRAVAPLASAVTELRLSARGAWQVVLDSGLSLELGRGDIHPRLARFVAAWPQLASQGLEARHADLRYTNGFAMANPLPDPLPRQREKRK
jgi:cell division protein FtsQ